MPKNRQYIKAPLDYRDLLILLSEKGLKINDQLKAEALLCNIGFYRLIGYGLAFEEYGLKGQRIGKYKEGTQFSDLAIVYNVDHKLRAMILEAVGKIEIALRSCIAHELSLKYDNPHWFLEASLFNSSDDFRHKDFLREVSRNTGKTAEEGSNRDTNRELFIRHYYAEYNSPEYPPIWMVAEVLPIGSWSKIFQHLKVSKDRKLISSRFDLAPPTLDSWLHSLTFIRNASAHHSRLFAKKLPLPPKIDKGLPLSKDNYVFNHICVIDYFLSKIEPSNNWLAQVQSLLQEVAVNQKHFGFKR